MKRHLAFAEVVVVLLIASVSALAQTRPGIPGAAASQLTTTQPTPNVEVPNTKIAIVDTRIFSDEKAGITRYVNAVKSVQLPFQSRTKELVLLQDRIKGIADGIAKLNAAPAGTPVTGLTLQARQEASDRLLREFRSKKEELDADLDKAYNEVVSPVSRDIGNALDQYAAQHGLTMVLDISKMLPAILTVNPAMDITQPFIADYNSKNP